MNRLFKFISIVALLLFSPLLNAQLEIDERMNKSQLKQFFENGGSLEIKKIKYKGSGRAIGMFEDPDSIFNMRSGLALSTGAVKKIPGPNKEQGMSSNNFSLGYNRLDRIARADTKDAAVLEITFVPKEAYFSFNYVFGSEEYPEFVSSSFNDAFAFFLTGPNGEKANLALIPDSMDPIAINTVNHLRNQWYYVNNSRLLGEQAKRIVDTREYWVGRNQYEIRTTYNIEAAIVADPKIPVEFDGFTKLLQAKAKVEPGKTYKLTICIADASDRIYDTGVLIEKGSMLSNPNKDFRSGALATDTNYYFTRDTVLVYTKPEIPNIDIAEVICRDTLVEVFYNTNISTLTLQDMQDLQQLINGLNPSMKYRLSIESYTDQDGSFESNQKLSERRSKHVLEYIESFKLQNLTVESSSGKGVDPNLQKQKADKRRTEIRFKCE